MESYYCVGKHRTMDTCTGRGDKFIRILDINIACEWSGRFTPPHPSPVKDSPVRVGQVVE